ncbi:hypothetical protein PFICI_00399 [Pestalotiopsis fici W106-1]|uniref:DUF6594 domain-containing protein n=1 Tax=Pestalotiopsis fici (strain W106-1 / CGMCC3.15140) TaxID=1229662 RepID=W3XMP6_PESFW|nr:uncharacterized protein PFICI_00399 [Pestalotiopsis fici W106-1]ETS86571.1 hypothetical protein PFICI_00399 [Pestalotiopsis fici W106-1]
MLTQQVENYPSGYPRFTALLSAYSPYFLCRRFDQLRARLLLLKQDRLSMLEQKLEEVDRNEASLLFLGKSRCDRNVDRISVLSDIETCLSDYDDFVERTTRILSLGKAQHRDVESLQNWLDGNGCLAREEAAYLSHRELITLAPPRDNAIAQFEAWIEDKLIRFDRNFRKSHFHDVSNDPNVYIYSGSHIRRAARTLLLCLITVLLLMPVVLCNSIVAVSARMTVIVLSTILYLLVISELTQSRTLELVVAGATVRVKYEPNTE